MSTIVDQASELRLSREKYGGCMEEVTVEHHLQEDCPQEFDILAEAEEVGIHERREAVVRGPLLHGWLMRGFHK